MILLEQKVSLYVKCFHWIFEYTFCEPSSKHNGPNNHLPDPLLPHHKWLFLNTKKRCKIICFTHLSYNLVHPKKKGVQNTLCKVPFSIKRMTSSHICLTFVDMWENAFGHIPTHSSLASGSYLFINICSSKLIVGPPFVGNVFCMLLCCRMELWIGHISKIREGLTPKHKV
jgi:hypothetical protein